MSHVERTLGLSLYQKHLFENEPVHPCPRQISRPDYGTKVPDIGHPMHFVSGQFSGQSIRAELQETQKAELGRKCESPIHALTDYDTNLCAGMRRSIGDHWILPLPFYSDFFAFIMRGRTANLRRKLLTTSKSFS